jgi:CRP-like cAMP-binding protein
MSARDSISLRAPGGPKPAQAPKSSRAQAASPMQNRLLAALPRDDYERLLPELQPFALEPGFTFHEPGSPERHLYFLTSGVVGKSYVMKNGDSATFALAGREGAVGLALFLGADGAPTRATMISAGFAYRLRADLVKSEFEGDAALRQLLLRYTQALITQISQTAVCNRLHSLEQRLCRCLLSCLDRLPSNELAITQQAVADMLGVRRESVSEAMGRLEEAGLIRGGRGHLAVLDRGGIQARACECYPVVKREYERSLQQPASHTHTGASLAPAPCGA